MTYKELLNNLALEMYAITGYKYKYSKDMEESSHPTERAFFDMAVNALKCLTGIDYYDVDSEEEVNAGWLAKELKKTLTAKPDASG